MLPIKKKELNLFYHDTYKKKEIFSKIYIILISSTDYFKKNKKKEQENS